MPVKALIARLSNLLARTPAVAVVFTFVVSLSAVWGQEAPSILNVDSSSRLNWSYSGNGPSTLIAQVETTTNLDAAWEAIAYDLASSNLVLPKWTPYAFDLPTNTVHSTSVPSAYQPSQFYRLLVRSNTDPSLKMQLSFDNDFTNHGIVVDVSGNGNHGYRYEKTRWPASVKGPDGSQAARFHIYTDGFGSYKRSGDYITVRNDPSLDNLTNATISAWAYFDNLSTADQAKQWDSTIIDAGGFETTLSWTLGRLNSSQTYFYVHWADSAGAGHDYKAITFPDVSTTAGNTGGWHHYAVTFDGTYLRGYFDGSYVTNYTTNGLTKLILGGTYIGIGCWNFSATPILYDGDLRPNNGWIEGSVDDIRIYNRTMNDAEIKTLYGSYDKVNPPSVPTNVWARVASPNQMELRWGPSKDDFFVTGYRVMRNGAQIAVVTGPSYVDQTVIPSQSYTYAVEAIDAGGHGSGLSAAVTTNTTASSPIEVVVDDADGPGRIEIAGTWVGATNATSFGGTCVWGTESRGTKSITFHPTLPAPGDYSVYVWYGGTPSQDVSYFYSLNTPIDIVHNGTTNLVQINQQNGYKSWKLLGTFTFTGDTNELVRIRTDGTALAGHPTWGGVVADAVKFTK